MKTYHDLPIPNANALARCAALTKVIHSEIAQHHGVLPFRRFMELALYHPEWGYYQSPDIRLGKKGDFTTASEISPLYAHCFARQSLALFKLIGANHVLELGAGSGQFAYDYLAHLADLSSLPDQYYIYERSLSLKIQQQQLLASLPPEVSTRVVWLEHLPETFNGIIIANEVLDALPFDCFTIDKGLPCERVVASADDDFVWKTVAAAPTLQNEIAQLHTQYALTEGYQSEINLVASDFTRQLCQILKKGVILFADYGYGQAEYYHPARTQGTLSCFYQHHTHQDPLRLPGLQDMTAHVDFTRIIATAVDHGGNLLGYTTQSAFLLANGLLQEAMQREVDLNPAEALSLHHEIKLLTMPMEMGDRVKIMAIGKELETTLTTFTHLDRRRDL